MDNILENLNNTKNLKLKNDLDLEVSQNLTDFKKVTENVIYSGVEYAIKSLELNDQTIESLNEIKKSFKTKDFKEILSTAIDCSVKFGLEVAKTKFPVLKTIDGLKNISVKGGAGTLISSAIDIFANKYLKGNLINDGINKFFDNIKNFVRSNAFIQKIEQGIKRIKDRVDKFKDMCSNWYQAYEKFDLNDINNIANAINKFSTRVSNNIECLKENNIIQNMTELINNKMDKLSKTQIEVCANI